MMELHEIKWKAIPYDIVKGTVEIIKMAGNIGEKTNEWQW